MRDEYKEVSWRFAEPHTVINHWRHGNRTCFGKYYVADANVARITLWPVLADGTFNHTSAEYIPSDEFKLIIPMTRKELEDKYHSKAKEVVERLQRTIPLGDIGYHEMWNGWIGCDAFEFAQACVDENFEIVGVCYEIEPKPGVVDLTWMYDIGVVCEYKDGERFWCHYKSDYLQDIFDEWGVKR